MENLQESANNVQDFDKIPGPGRGRMATMGYTSDVLKADGLSAYGPVVVTGKNKDVFVFQPEIVSKLAKWDAQVQRGGQQIIGRQGGTTGALQQITGPGIITLDTGAEWGKLHEKLLPFYKKSEVHRKAQEVVYDQVDKMIEDLKTKVSRGKPFNIGQFFSRTTLGIILEGQMGVNMDKFPIRRYFGVMTSSLIAAIVPSQAGFDTSKGPLKILTKISKSFVGGVVKKHIIEKSKGDDTIIAALKSLYGDDMDSIVGTAAQLVSAGHETSAGVASFLVHNLANHRDQLQLIQNELANVDINNPTEFFKYLKGSALEAAIFETLRLYPATPFVPFTVVADEGINIAGYNIPKDKVGQVVLYSIQRNPEIWTDPDVFDLNRFLSGERYKEGQENFFFPFFTGPRVCLGRELAMIEVALMTAKIIQNFDFVSSTTEGVDAKTGVLKPKKHRIMLAHKEH